MYKGAFVEFEKPVNQENYICDVVLNDNPMQIKLGKLVANDSGFTFISSIKVDTSAIEENALKHELKTTIMDAINVAYLAAMNTEPAEKKTEEPEAEEPKKPNPPSTGSSPQQKKFSLSGKDKTNLGIGIGATLLGILGIGASGKDKDTEEKNAGKISFAKVFSCSVAIISGAYVLDLLTGSHVVSTVRKWVGR